MTKRISPSINGQVDIEVDEEGTCTADEAHELALSILDAAYISRAVAIADGAMAKCRGQFIPDSPEWALVDAVWRDLRLAFGYDDDPRTGGWRPKGGDTHG